VLTSFSAANVTVSSGDTVQAGGFVGYQENTPVENCYVSSGVVDVNISSSATVYAGGFTGEATGSSSSITNCFSGATVNANNTSGTVKAGGISGSGGDIIYCAAFGGFVTATGVDVGRIYGSGATVSTGSNHAFSGMYVNGFTISGSPGGATLNGESSDSDSFRNAYFWQTILEFDSTVWDFANVWRDGRPVHRD
jgi:hypothetical protein